MNRTTLFAMLGAALAGHTAVQAADAYPQQYPQQQYPQQQYPQQQYPQQQYSQQQGAQAHPMRALFAQSLATVAQNTGTAAVIAVADGLTGALKSWFDNRRQRKGANGALGNNNNYASNYPTDAPMAPQSYPAPSADSGGYPAPGDPNAYPAPGATSSSDSNGYPLPGNDSYLPPSSEYPAPTSTSAPGQLYAGIAYEIHLLQPNGATSPVDPLNYTFRTGDQFRVYYRPSLPGRVDVFNINAAGQNAQIDSGIVAAGELASLGPYEFTKLQGDETLILRLSPCTTQAAYQTTRNIVKAQGAPGASSTSDPLGFDNCSNTSTRGLKPKTRTRDIQKISVEGGTSFALDPISPAELGGGDMAPRQVTITLHHR